MHAEIGEPPAVWRHLIASDQFSAAVTSAALTPEDGAPGGTWDLKHAARYRKYLVEVHPLASWRTGLPLDDDHVTSSISPT